MQIEPPSTKLMPYVKSYWGLENQVPGEGDYIHRIVPSGLSELLDEITSLEGLRVDGLMTIGPLTDDRDAVRAAFRALREARDEEQRKGRPNAPLHHLSMGMTGDFDLAIAEGATIIRVGTALFGSRPPHS